MPTPLLTRARQNRCRPLRWRSTQGVLAAVVSLLAWACSNTPQPNAGWTPANRFTLADGGADIQTLDSAAPKPDVPKTETIADTAAGQEVSCNCSGIECGHPPGCPNTDCGTCPKGALCAKNICEADPNCACGPQDCGKLFCGKDCGGCDQGMTCLNNFCTQDCSCENIECGQLAGCDNTCGECGDGLYCKDHMCAPDPLCVCKPGMCGSPLAKNGKPCPNNCGSCQPGEVCKSNLCTAGGTECPCNGIACGFSKTTCAKSCGTCQINQFCSSNQCKVADPKVKKKFGEPCGPSEECLVPQAGASQFAQKQFIECLHNQCIDGLCVQGVCSRKCKMTADQINNVSGAAGPDGIEDPGLQSDCMGAAVGPSGGNFRCVEQNTPIQVAAGMSDPICLPGSTFSPCQTSSECPAGELCRVTPIFGDFQSRCGPRVSNPIGTAGAIPSLYCNDNPVADTVALCETGWCTSKGCIALCKGDGDCVTASGGCKAGKCSAGGAKCVKDADCPLWKCKTGVQYSDASPTLFKACQPL